MPNQKDGAYFSMGLDTPVVSMTMHAENREKLVNMMKKEQHGEGIIFMRGGKQKFRYDTDVELVFRQESFFNYLFGINHADCLGTIELPSGKSVLFIPRLPDAYAVWEGVIHTTDHYKKKYEVDEVKYTDEIEEYFKSENPKKIFTMKGNNSDSGRPAKAANFEGIKAHTVDNEVLYEIISECRVIKSKQELDLMKAINVISSNAHKAVMRGVKAGMMEYQIESMFLNEIYARGGCRFVAYTCICGAGNSGATLHYGRNDQPVRENDIVLLDMGGEYHCYASDITCSYPVSGKFNDKQKIIYNAVLTSVNAVLDALKPGVSWPSMHRLAERTLLTELKKAEIVVGSVDEMMDNFIGNLFQPHGLGHLMGCDVHDVGGYPTGCCRSEEPGLKNLRAGRNLEAGMVLTVEPGCYFIDAVLLPALKDPVKSKFLNADKIEEFRGFGGVRIEDDIIITESGYEMMTQVPRTIEEIELWMSGKDYN